MSNIKVNSDFSVPQSEIDKVESLKKYRSGQGFTEYTTGTENYSTHMSSEGTEKKGDYEVYRVTDSTFLSSRKIHRVV